MIAPAACEATSFAVQAALSLFCELTFYALRVHAGLVWLLYQVQGHRCICLDGPHSGGHMLWSLCQLTLYMKHIK